MEVKDENMIPYFICFLVSFGITAIILKYLIPVLRSKKMGQRILDIGPRWHKDKEGTPTMGGITMILSVVIATVVFAVLPGRKDDEILILLLSAFLFGVIGFVDDYIKVVNGLRSTTINPRILKDPSTKNSEDLAPSVRIPQHDRREVYVFKFTRSTRFLRRISRRHHLCLFARGQHLHRQHRYDAVTLLVINQREKPTVLLHDDLRSCQRLSAEVTEELPASAHRGEFLDGAFFQPAAVSLQHPALGVDHQRCRLRFFAASHFSPRQSHEVDKSSVH